MRALHLTAPLGLLLTLTVGCMPGEPEPAPAPQSDDDLVRASADALVAYMCDYIDRCPAENPGFKAAKGFIDAGGDCRAALDGRLIDLESVVGFVPIDLETFAECHARSVAACAPFMALPGCREALASDRGEGEPCAAGRCGPGLYCAYDFTVEEGMCGEYCAPLRAPGESCQGDDDCADVDGRVGQCVDGEGGGRCTTMGHVVGELGAPCGLIVPAGQLELVTCGTDAHCLPDADGSTCQRPRQAGAACRGSAECAGGMLCLDDVCRAPEVLGAPGGACVDDADEGPVCNAFAGLECIAGACVATDGRAGSPCDPDRRNEHCRPGHYCTDDGTCQPQRVAGDACDGPEGDRQCRRGSCVEDADAGGWFCEGDPWAACFEQG